MHPHHNFIIMAFVLSGALTHINSTGEVDELGADDHYVFSAGSGGKHSEFNIGAQDLNVIYVWVLPAQPLAPPSYRRGRFDRRAGANSITCLVGDETVALPIGQAFRVSRLLSDADRRHVYRPGRANGFYAFVLNGDVEIANAVLTRRVSIALEREDKVEIAARNRRHGPAAGGDEALTRLRLRPTRNGLFPESNSHR